MIESKRMQRRDRPWVDANVTIMCGPFDMPPLDAMRAAVEAVAAESPASRLRWGLDESRRRWLLNRPIESIVVERDWDDVPHYAAAIDAIASDESFEPPLTLIRYPSHLGMKMSHCLGDGLIFVSVIAAALLSAVNGEAVTWPTEPAGRFPLARAAVRTFAANPGRLVTVVRERYRAVPGSGPPKVTPWTPSRRTVYTALPTELTDEVYAWKASYAPSASKFGVQAGLYLRALRKVGLEISDNVPVMVDLRGYLGSRLIDGNFFAGVPTCVHNGMTPEKITTVVRGAKLSGRPVANQMMTTLRVGSALPRPKTFDANALPQVTLSFLGSPPQVEWLPYRSGCQPAYAASVEPGGPLGVTLIHGHCRGQIILNSCFHDNVVSSELIAEAHRLMAADPIGLLSEGTGES